MSSQPPQPNFSPNVVSYIKGEISRRTEYKVALERTPKFLGYDEFKKRRNTEQRDNLQLNIDRLTQDIIAITKKHFPDIEIDPNPEITISNVLASLPQPDEVKRIRVISSRLGAP